MSDGQSFYIILALFYFIDCLKFAPPGTVAFAGRAGNLGNWSPGEPFIELAGVNRLVFLAPLLPWPSVMVLPRQPLLIGPTRHVRNVRRLTRCLMCATAGLRMTSTALFLHFFLVIPVVYHFHRGEVVVLVAIALGYLMLVVMAFQYYRIHRRFLPNETGERLKGVLYTAFLPWHAMRCADGIIAQYTAPWCQLPVAAANAGHRKNLEYLRRLWRRAHIFLDAAHRPGELADLLDSAGVDASEWLLPPELTDGSEKFCPVCHLGYSTSSDECLDCRGVRLSSFAPEQSP